MKKLAFLWLLALILTACAQGPQAPAETPEPTGQTPTPRSLRDEMNNATPEPEVKSLDILSAEDLAWPEIADTVVISATNCCGFTPNFVQANNLPAAIVFGDGRILWTKLGDQGERQVLQGQLSQDEMTQFLQKAAEEGFFEWKELYTDPLSPSDMPTQCLSIKLLERERRVCEYYKGAPEAFHELYDRLATGLEADGQPYQPEKAYLLTYPQPVEEGQQPTPEPPTWDAAAMGFSLEDAVEGRWIEGPALEAAWKQANQNVWAAMFKEGENYYYIALQIPSVSYFQPPQP